MVVDLYTYRITIGDGDGRSRGKKMETFSTIRYRTCLRPWHSKLCRSCLLVEIRTAVFLGWTSIYTFLSEFRVPTGFAPCRHQYIKWLLCASYLSIQSRWCESTRPFRSAGCRRHFLIVRQGCSNVAGTDNIPFHNRTSDTFDRLNWLSIDGARLLKLHFCERLFELGLVKHIMEWSHWLPTKSSIRHIVS